MFSIHIFERLVFRRKSYAFSRHALRELRATPQGKRQSYFFLSFSTEFVSFFKVKPLSRSRVYHPLVVAYSWATHTCCNGGRSRCLGRHGRKSVIVHERRRQISINARMWCRCSPHSFISLSLYLSFSFLSNRTYDREQKLLTSCSSRPRQ